MYPRDQAWKYEKYDNISRSKILEINCATGVFFFAQTHDYLNRLGGGGV